MHRDRPPGRSGRRVRAGLRHDCTPRRRSSSHPSRYGRCSSSDRAGQPAQSVACPRRNRAATTAIPAKTAALVRAASCNPWTNASPAVSRRPAGGRSAAPTAPPSVSRAAAAVSGGIPAGERGDPAAVLRVPRRSRRSGRPRPRTVDPRAEGQTRRPTRRRPRPHPTPPAPPARARPPSPPRPLEPAPAPSPAVPQAPTPSPPPKGVGPRPAPGPQPPAPPPRRAPALPAPVPPGSPPQFL
jgi:hypothetical protein